MVAACTAENARALWHAARALIPATGRAPVLTENGSMQISELFSRTEFEHGPSTDDITPRGLIAQAGQVDVEQFVQRLAQKMDADGTWQDVVERELHATQHLCGQAPSMEAVLAAQIDGRKIRTTWDLDRWLVDWELANGASIKQLARRQNGYSMPAMSMVLLPTSDSWDALAYMHWFGAQHFSSASYLALGKRWQSQFGAEIYAHFGTMFECLVERPPQSLAEAWRLAREQHLVAPYSLYASGLSTRCLAAGLIGHDHWFFHERP